MKEIPLTQGRVTIIDDEDFEQLSKFKWYYSVGYAIRNKPGSKRNKILMHRVICKTPDGMETDHINGDRLDNQKSNLRPCTRSQNKQNRPAQKNNTAGYKGVYWHKQSRKWAAGIRFHGKVTFLGLFISPIEAARSYDRAARELFKDFSYMNWEKQNERTTGTIQN